MAVRWNNEFYTAVEHRDLQANAMAVDNTGSYVLLAGRRYIAIRNLDNLETEQLRKFPRQSKYEVGSAEWNPTGHHSELCVISSNERLEVLTWRVGELTQTHSIRAHTRVITDLNWHRAEPNILASCSVDTFIHIWDLRDSRRPSLSLSAIAEATQVRWNHINSYLLATAHDVDIKLWDQRKGTAPIQYISAHLSKIHGLDWSPSSETRLVTSSQDCTIKFFDTNNSRRAESTLTTSAPVWRARFTPFGNGLVTVVVPQLRRGENSLLLWNTDNRANPVHTFAGHRDVVLEFEWRKQRADETDYQLVTWSKDQTLFVWKIDPFLQKLCGHEPEESVGDDLMEELTRNSLPKVQPLQQEFSLLNVHIPNLEVIKMDVNRRTCTVKVDTSNGIVVLHVTFPNTYPHGVPPTFQVSQESTIENSLSNQLIQTLNHIAQQRVIKNRTCLEPCLRQLVTTIEQFASDPTEVKKQFEVSYVENNILGTFNDTYIPFPRTSGAKFCSVSLLVCFGRPLSPRRMSAKVETSTPRALSALGNSYSSKRSSNVTVSSYYYQRPRRGNYVYGKNLKAFVIVYDSSNLFYVNRQLAEKYILDGDVGTICKYNAQAASSVGRIDLVQAWTLAELVSSPQQAEEDMQWTEHPFGTQLMQPLIMHYARQSDIQMAAMLCCIFGKEQDNAYARKSSLKNLLSPGSGSSPYHTIPPADIVAEGWVFPLLRSTRSSSLDNLRIEEHVQPIVPQKNSSSNLYEYYKLAYADILHRWGLLYNRAEVLKYMATPNEIHKGVEFLTDCQICLKPTKHCSCSSCKKLSLNCIICHVSVRGSANCCVVCGHGGHTLHMQQWFLKNKICPSGCGCSCLTETAGMFMS